MSVNVNCACCSFLPEWAPLSFTFIVWKVIRSVQRLVKIWTRSVNVVHWTRSCTTLTITHENWHSTNNSTYTHCLSGIRAWMNHNFLWLNSSKTETILIGSPHQTRSSTITCITFSDQDIPLSPLVTNLGIRFNPHLTFEAHIKYLCKTSFHHLRNIARLRPTHPTWSWETHSRLCLLETGLL